MHTGHVIQNTAVLAVIISVIIKIKKLKLKLKKRFFLSLFFHLEQKKGLTIDIALFILYVFETI